MVEVRELGTCEAVARGVPVFQRQQRTLADAARTGRTGCARNERLGGASDVGLEMSATPTKLETLAIHGGTPVRETLLPYGRQSLNDEDIQAVVEVLKSDWLTTGPKVDEFEERFAAWVGTKHAVSFSSGTAALHASAFAAGLKSGDEAVTTPMTFCATANCVLYQGSTPVFADVTADTLNLDPREVSQKISPRTKAVIAVDYAGHPADLAALRELAAHHGLVMIEDACHALGAEHFGKRVGGIA